MRMKQCVGLRQEKITLSRPRCWRIITPHKEVPTDQKLLHPSLSPAACNAVDAIIPYWLFLCWCISRPFLLEQSQHKLKCLSASRHAGLPAAWTVAMPDAASLSRLQQPA